jgi:hypothetical protein
MSILMTVSVGTRTAAIVADLIVLAVTWYKTVRIVKEAHLMGIRVPIGEILFRDGEFSSAHESLKLELKTLFLRLFCGTRRQSLLPVGKTKLNIFWSPTDHEIFKELCWELTF